MTKPVILTAAGRYLPGYKAGGPIRSIANVVEALGDEFEFKIVALDRDLGDAEPYPGIISGWQQVGKSRVAYAETGAQAAKMLKAEGRKADLIWLNTLFDPHFGLSPLLNRLGGRLLISPRGQLGAGALSIKPVRKRLAMSLLRAGSALDAVTWHATSHTEQRDIERETGAEAIVAPNVVAEFQAATKSKSRGALNVAFVGRISPKKNLAAAIRFIRAVNGNVRLDVYGEAEDPATADECRRLAEGANVAFHGAVSSPKLESALARAQVILSPTLGENFGHAIIEGMLAGCPAILSDRTPWRNLNAAKAGFDLPLCDESAFVHALQFFVDLSDEEFGTWSDSARAFALRAADPAAAVEAHRRLFMAALG